MKWFRHDSDAHRDDKLEKVLMRYGAAGYALYWLCLELIAATIDRKNINFELKHDAEVLAYRLKIDSANVEEMMRYMVSLDLFSINQTTNRITCLKLASRLENSIVKNPELQRIQQLIKNQSHENPGQSGKIPENIGQLGTDIDTDIDKYINKYINTLSGKPDESPPSKPKTKQNPQRDVARRIIDFLNVKSGRNYGYVDAHINLMLARLREGYTEDQFRQVIAKKCRDWEGELQQYIRPKTLFSRVNFANYVGELGREK